MEGKRTYITYIKEIEIMNKSKIKEDIMNK